VSEAEALANLDAYAKRLDLLEMSAAKVCLLSGNVGTVCGRVIGYPAPEPTSCSDYAPARVFRRLPEEQRCAECSARLRGSRE
jgi:rubredoxin